VAVGRDTARTAGADPAQLVLAAGAEDVHTVVVGGRELVRDGRHVELGDPGPLLAAAIERAWRRP
jgi:cytosine/adenosine deaminase-related metal-dependent hydrolase